jgi:hypothetical protein
MTPDMSTMSLANRVVLFGLASLETTDETPAHAPAVRHACTGHASELADTVVGTLDEATVARALNELEADSHVERVAPDHTSPVGKGRPEFSLVDDADVVLDALAGDDHFASAVATVRGDS